MAHSGKAEKTCLDAVPYQVGNALVAATELAINCKLLKESLGEDCTHTAFLTIFCDDGGGYLWDNLDIGGGSLEKLTSENF